MSQRQADGITQKIIEAFNTPGVLLANLFVYAADDPMPADVYDLNSQDVDRVLHTAFGLRSPNLKVQDSEANFEVAIEGSTIRLAHKDSFVSESHIHDEENLAILESLGLIRYVVLNFHVQVKSKERGIDVQIYYYHLTLMGVELCEVCSRPRVRKLREIDAISRGKNLKYQDPFLNVAS